ncbi:MAG: hypothetical protein NVSMB17_14490 [Candidatus Dormibacteria bacterium]
MESQNITLALPRALLKKAKILAARRETSVSALVAAALEEAVRADDAYEPAMQRALVRARAGYALGSSGRVGIDRDELHER